MLIFSKITWKLEMSARISGGGHIRGHCSPAFPPPLHPCFQGHVTYCLVGNVVFVHVCCRNTCVRNVVVCSIYSI